MIFLEKCAEFDSRFVAIVHNMRKNSFFRKLRRMKVLFMPRRKCSRTTLFRR